jgi:N-(2-amino-2-carboxyethyl)-L-glutamate synthase
MNSINTGLLDLVGNTPVVKMKSYDSSEPDDVELFAKLEYYNPTGSTKDRPAAYIVRHLMLSGKLTKDSTVIESSSGNFGIALAAICRSVGIKFICVVDPGLLPHNEFLLRQYGAELIKVTVRDDTGGYLKTRIKVIHEMLERNPQIVWLNQYANQMNAQAHYYGTGMEIYKTFSDFGLDYVFIPVGSGGTVAGVSRLLKEQFPPIQVIAVDAVGSVIFGGEPKRRYIPGMGSSIRPELIEKAQIDHVLAVEERDSISACMELLHRYGLFVGGSSGAVYAAAKQFFVRRGAHVTPECDGRAGRPATALLLFPDRGERYSSTIYSADWVADVFPPEQAQLASVAE